MKFVCKNCFSDKELKGFIISHNTVGNCSCCKDKDVEVIEIEELFDFFKELLENFEPNPIGERLISKIQGNWSLFANLEYARTILNHVLSKISTSIHHSEVQVDFSGEIFENINHWSKLKEQLKWERRYITNIDYLTEDLGWDGFFESKTIINENDNFFRARLHENADKEAFSKDQMLCPPKELSSAGRANSIGIPYLYLSDNENTTLYEIRATFLDEVSIATFQIQQNIPFDIVISDFTEIPCLYAPNNVNQRIKSTLLKQIISRDLSKPMRRYDSELDYIPTQFICEFIKVFTNVQGIKFRSSLHSAGNNIVLFNQDIMECKSVRKINISKVLIESSQS